MPHVKSDCYVGVGSTTINVTGENHSHRHEQNGTND